MLRIREALGAAIPGTSSKSSFSQQKRTVQHVDYITGEERHGGRHRLMEPIDQLVRSNETYTMQIRQ